MVFPGVAGQFINPKTPQNNLYPYGNRVYYPPKTPTPERAVVNLLVVVYISKFTTSEYTA